MDMEQLYSYVPRELVTFVLVTLFSLLIGLSQRRISLKREGETTLFGTDRTFTFIGILGYLLYILDPTVQSVEASEALRVLSMTSSMSLSHSERPVPLPHMAGPTRSSPQKKGLALLWANACRRR